MSNVNVDMDTVTWDDRFSVYSCCGFSLLLPQQDNIPCYPVPDVELNQTGCVIHIITPWLCCTDLSNRVLYCRQCWLNDVINFIDSSGEKWKMLVHRNCYHIVSLLNVRYGILRLFSYPSRAVKQVLFNKNWKAPLCLRGSEVTWGKKHNVSMGSLFLLPLATHIQQGCNLLAKTIV